MLAWLAAVMALSSPLPGAEPKAKDGAADGGAAAAGDEGRPPAPDRGSPKKKERAAGARDPVASAFALPRGGVLNPKQQAAYDNLKQNSEAELRQAFDNVQQAENAAATAKALREVRECRAKIRAAIQDILAMPYNEAPSQASQQPGSSGSEGSRPGGYAPQYGNYGGYAPWYPYGGNGYYPYGGNGYYPYGGSSYPYRSYNPSSSSQNTKTGGSGQGSSSTGSSSTTGKPQGTTTSAPKPASKPSSKPASKR
jgi:hypothetical protein